MYDLELSAKGVTVKLNAVFVGEDLLVWLGGGQAHIGAVALATPRAGLDDSGKTGADASILTVSGHKEDLLARKIALALAAKLNVRVCVTAGLHWDSATPTRIEAAKELSMRLTKTLLMHIAKDKQTPADVNQSEPAPAGNIADAQVAKPAQALQPARPTAKPPATGHPETPARPEQPAVRPLSAVARPATAVKTVPPSAAKAAPAGAVTTAAGVIVEKADNTQKPQPKPAANGVRPVARDAQGRPVTVRQAVNATLKKPLLKK